MELAADLRLPRSEDVHVFMGGVEAPGLGWRLRSARPCSSATQGHAAEPALRRGVRFVAGGLADGELGDGAVELRVVLPRADQMVEIGVPGRRGVEGQPACQRVDDDRVETLGFTSGPLSNRVAPQRGAPTVEKLAMLLREQGR